MNRGTLAAGVAGAALAVGGLVAAQNVDGVSLSAPDYLVETTTEAIGVPLLAAGDYPGTCAIVTPPEPDPCDAAALTLRDFALGAFARGAYDAKWRAANPGEVGRLVVFMQQPKCSTATTPQPQIMRTEYGAGLYHVAAAIACARHPEQITLPPTPAPLNPARSDKQAPTAPGPITVTPGG